MRSHRQDQNANFLFHRLFQKCNGIDALVLHSQAPRPLRTKAWLEPSDGILGGKRLIYAIGVSCL
jgi:hypothetical protein